MDEDGGTASLIITLYPGVRGGVTVDYVTTDGTAIAPDDYTAIMATATIGAGEGKDCEETSYSLGYTPRASATCRHVPSRSPSIAAQPPWFPARIKPPGTGRLGRD